MNAVRELPHGDVWVTKPDDVTVYLDLVGKAVAVGADWRRCQGTLTRLSYSTGPPEPKFGSEWRLQGLTLGQLGK